MDPLTQQDPPKSLVRRGRQRKPDALRADLEYQKAKLRSLQAKLNPHFLFNLLNVIRALVHVNPDRADLAITWLAGLLRNNLRTTETTLIRLGEELDQIRTLLQLADLRFGARLESRIQVPEILLEVPVPPMLLLNLVENAITHGIGNLEEGGVISITATVNADHIRISILNSGRLDLTSVRGLGTRDALQRLEILFGGAAEFSLSQHDKMTVAAIVRLPIPQNFHHPTHS